MKKSQIFTITACSVAAVLLTGVLVVGLSDDGFRLTESPVRKPKTHQHQVDIDLTETPVSGLDIYWVDGQVDITQSPDGNVHVIEHSANELTEADQMDVAVSGGTLNIKWDGQWYNKFTKWISFGWFLHGGKELTVQLPAETAVNLEKLKVATTSGDVDLGLVCSAATAQFSTTSGDLNLINLTVEKDLSASSVSGEITLTGAQCQQLNVSTTSGGLELEGLIAQEANLSSTSGDCLYTGQVDTLHMSTVSGTMEAKLSACPVESHMEAVSGELYLSIPENPGFTVEYSTVSGGFDCDFPLEQLGKQGHLRYGNGAGLLTFDSTSGEIEIERRGA